MKILYLFCLALGSSAFAQTITFNGCHNIFDDQNFVFTKTGVGPNNKNIYVTTPVDGQPCSGLGTCEFKIQWNNTLTRWEFLADEGNGTFTTPNVVYYNSTGNTAAMNPPAITIGTWVENTAFTSTGGGCGGNLTTGNATMTGDVHTTFLGTSDVAVNSGAKIQIFPNPVADYITVSGIDNAKSVQVYSISGQMVISETFDKKINVSQLTSGIYILRIHTKDSQSHEFKFVKK
ncbi:T9SS type A sorting domain-containing protein [Chryseobacterium sp. MMS23-Vi53]|uniref:T9SS type A sorting domain-containing protein n=1 Tax=Chryseobacterium sp. MMS23-Vi53 TaxID=3386644 RepID=UPI0039E7D77E